MVLTELKALQVDARKRRDGTRSTLLTTIIGEAEMRGKNDGNRATTSEDILTVLRKFEGNLKDNLALYTAKQVSKDILETVQVELDIVRSLLPKEIDALVIRRDILELKLPMEQKSLGKIIPTLKTLYGPQFNPQQVSAIFKEMLSDY